MLDVLHKRFEENTDYSITHLAEVLAASERPKPRIYHACGGQDPWLDMNLIVRKCFEDLACPADVTDTIDNGKADIPYCKLEPIAVTRENMDEEITGKYHEAADIYLNVERESEESAADNSK